MAAKSPDSPSTSDHLMDTIHRNDKSVLITVGLLLAGTLAYASVHSGLLQAGIAGGALFGMAFAVALISRGGALSQVALPVLGMAMVALMIHVARGHTEAHFAVFAFLAVTVVYRHWLPVLAAAAAIAVHHLSFNYFQQWGWGPICFTEPGLAKVLEHAAYVVAEAGVLVFLALRAQTEFAAGEELNTIATRLVDAEGRVDFAAIRLASDVPTTRCMLEALQRIERSIATVRTSADSIGTAAGEVAAGSLDLSTRTEQAASNLQQTASSMEQLTSTVNQASESAHAASQLAESAAAVAQRGGQVVGQVVLTMDEINASSRKIADIIGVIDGIAFQTNILALNAAVEAARAGEQGRGFAVVAGEVRSLAQRSAEASREIKALIGSSVDSVEAGTRRVRDAGSTMNEIVTSVRRVAEMIAEISLAAAEQSQGIGQVNASVAQLDQMTQQNAALVEQSASAADSLREQAGRLSQAVSAFRLSSDGVPTSLASSSASMVA
ncbi:MAG: chemotaxis protein [Ideonella sp.]|nr:chemotaxis protein [Ideonella sp.]